MATETFRDWCKESTATTGTGTITLAGATAASFTEFTDVLVDGAIVPYAIIDGNDREEGLGTFTATGTLLARTTVLATWVSGTYDDTAPTAISLSGSAEVYITMSSFQAMSRTDTKFTNMLYRDTATLNGTAINGHVNLGSGASVTGTTAQAYDYCTVGGGLNVSAINQYATASGGSNVSATGAWATASGGISSVASGTSSSVGGGNGCVAQGSYSTVPGGRGGKAAHTHSVAMGGGALTRANFDVVIGATDTGTASSANNTIRLQGTGGNIKIDGAVTSPEADYAEMFEWYDGNPDEQDRVGRFVSLHQGKIVQGAGRSDKTGIYNYLASLFTSPNSSTSIEMIGIISGTPSIIGDGAPNHWNGRNVKDKFGRKNKLKYTKHEWVDLDEDHIIVYVSDADGKQYSEYPQYTHKGIIDNSIIPVDSEVEIIEFPEVSEGYNPNTPYIPRSERQEWDAVGLIGKLVVDSAEPITVDYVDPTGDGRAVNGTKYRVLEVIDNYTVRIFFK